MELPGPPTALQLFYNDGGELGDEVLFGTADGKIGLLQLTRQGPNTKWLLEQDGSYGAIQGMDNYDITGDGVRDLIVGRHDGTVEVYAYDEGEDAEPVLKFSNVKLLLVIAYLNTHLYVYFAELWRKYYFNRRWDCWKCRI